MPAAEQSRTVAVCSIAGLGCLLAVVFLALMSRLFFEDYDLAFSSQLPLTVSGDIGCLAGLLLMAALKVKDAYSPLGGYAVAFSSAGLAFSLLLKAGFIVPTTLGSLLVGDFFAGLFSVACAYCWWLVYADMDENHAVGRFCLALIMGAGLFYLINLAPDTLGRIAGSVALPLAMCLCFLPVVADRLPPAREGASGAGSQRRAADKGKQARLPRIAILTLALSFFVADLELDLFPTSLYFEGVSFGTMPDPAVSCLAIVIAFAVVLYLLARRGPVPLSFLYTTGFILTAAGYLATPYRFEGGLPLAASEAGRIVIMCFALVFVLRFVKRSEGGQNPQRAFLSAGVVMFCAMVLADVLVVAVQMQEGFDYGDFVFRTVFSTFAIALLVILLLGPLPRMSYALESRRTSHDGALVSAKGRCEAFASQHGLSVRETEVLVLLAGGRDVPYIEKELVLAKSTVKTHIKHIYEKCGVSSRQNLLDRLEGLDEEKTSVR